MYENRRKFFQTTNIKTKDQYWLFGREDKVKLVQNNTIISINEDLFI